MNQESKQDMLREGVTTDPSLSTREKETCITVDNDRDTLVVHSTIPVHIRWILSIEHSRVIHHRMHDGCIVALKAVVPKGYVKLQGTNRQSQTNGSMVSYGPYKLDS